jgi:hypothetical protein
VQNTIPEVDAYIAEAAPFARPILERLRATVHRACPELREELKWSTPHFVRNGIVFGMAAFKRHVGFGFWRGKDMKDPENLFRGAARASMCYVKVTSVAELPPAKVLTAYVVEAVALDDAAAGTGSKKRAAKKKATKKKTARRPAPVAPDDLLAALGKKKRALATYEAFPPSKQRDYVEWVTEAKREETRARRIAQAVEWMAEGKSRNWKYERC